MKKYPGFTLVSVLGLSLLAGCGDNSATAASGNRGNAGSGSTVKVDSFDDIPECTSRREGSQVYVKEEGVTIVCSDGEWFVKGDASYGPDDDYGDGYYDDYDDVGPSYPSVMYCSGMYPVGATREITDAGYTLLQVCDSDGSWVTLSSTPVMTAPVTCAGGYIDGATKVVVENGYTSTYVCASGAWFLMGSTPVVPSPTTPVITSSASVIKSSSSVYVPVVGGTFTGNLFDGSSGDHRVYTGLDNGTETSGYWFAYADDADGGVSSLTWPVPLGNEYSDDALDPVVDYCGGICGTYSLNMGTLEYNPFVGVGFNVAGTDDWGFAESADASSWGGVCVSYTSDMAITLEMGIGEAGDAELGYDQPAVGLPKSPTGVEKCFTWTQFKQAGWGRGKITGVAAAARLAQLKFKVQGASGSSGTFNIMAISTYH